MLDSRIPLTPLTPRGRFPFRQLTKHVTPTTTTTTTHTHLHTSPPHSNSYIVGGFTGLFVAGGAVSAADPTSSETCITPAWRRAGVHVVWGAGWAANATLTQQQQVYAGISQLTQLVRGATPGSGAYWSESDYFEPEWAESFWGVTNYARLQTIKAAVDPTGVFTCHHCVGGQ